MGKKSKRKSKKDRQKGVSEKIKYINTKAPIPKSLFKILLWLLTCVISSIIGILFYLYFIDIPYINFYNIKNTEKGSIVIELNLINQGKVYANNLSIDAIFNAIYEKDTVIKDITLSKFSLIENKNIAPGEDINLIFNLNRYILIKKIKIIEGLITFYVKYNYFFNLISEQRELDYTIVKNENNFICLPVGPIHKKIFQDKLFRIIRSKKRS